MQSDAGIITMEDEIATPQASRPAVAARLRWLIDDAAGPERGSIRRFCEQSGLSYGRLRNALSKTNYLNMEDAIKIKNFCRVDLDFIYQGEIKTLEFQIATKLKSSTRLADFYRKEGVEPPDWLKIDDR